MSGDGIELERLRKILNRIDSQILSNLEYRQDIVRQVAEYKKQKKLPVLQPEREIEHLSKLEDEAEEINLNPELVRKIFELIIEDSRNIQENIKNDL
jgi:chorismate mutase